MGAIIYTAHRTETYSISFPYFYGSLVFAIPAGRQYSSFEKIFFPFKYIIWSCICTMFVVTITVTTALKFVAQRKRNFVIGPKNDSPLLNAINVCFGGTINRLPQRNFARSILTIWLLTSFVLRNSYQGTLLSFLRKEQRMQPLFYLEYILNTNVKLYLQETFYQQLYNDLPALRDR